MDLYCHIFFAELFFIAFCTEFSPFKSSKCCSEQFSLVFESNLYLQYQIGFILGCSPHLSGQIIVWETLINKSLSFQIVFSWESFCHQKHLVLSGKLFWHSVFLLYLVAYSLLTSIYSLKQDDHATDFFGGISTNWQLAFFISSCMLCIPRWVLLMFFHDVF